MQIVIVLLLLLLLGISGCSPSKKKEEKRTEVDKVEKFASLVPNLFLTDVDGIPWLLAVYRNEKPEKVLVDLGPVYEMHSYSVTLRENGEELPFVSNFIPTPDSNVEEVRHLYMSQNQAVFLLIGMPPVEFSENSSVGIDEKYLIKHNEYGRVELFTEPE